MAIGDAAFGKGDIMRRLHQLEGDLRELRSARRLESSTIGQGGLKVKGFGSIRSTNFDGDVTTGDPGTEGWALGAERLALRGQLVGPVGFGSARDVQFNVTIQPGVPGEILAESTIGVPDWADEAIVIATADATGDNTGIQNDDAFFVYAHIDGLNGHEAMVRLATDQQLSASATLMHVISNPDEQIRVACGVRSNIDTWPGATSNSRAAINAIAIFRRAT